LTDDGSSVLFTNNEVTSSAPAQFQLFDTTLRKILNGETFTNSSGVSTYHLQYERFKLAIFGVTLKDGTAVDEIICDANEDTSLQLLFGRYDTLTGVSEIDGTIYACNGANIALVKQSIEPAGANCATGGIKIQYGLDSNADGVLEANEVTNTAYSCNAGGHSGLVNLTPEPAGVNCATGGIRIDYGVDTNDNGILEADPDQAYNAAGIPWQDLINVQDAPILADIALPCSGGGLNFTVNLFKDQGIEDDDFTLYFDFRDERIFRGKIVVTEVGQDPSTDGVILSYQ